MNLFASLGVPIACLPHAPKAETNPSALTGDVWAASVLDVDQAPAPKPKGQPKSTRGHEADRAHRSTRAGYSSIGDMLKMGVWLAENRRVPSVDEVIAHVGVSVPTAYRWRNACADFLGVELPSSRWPKKGA